ncbi:hypothetical protein DMUE_3265 [Dictyocoela muelleri]|nr:hypothetical protein DMUE_3265 [Dictyocoela muelleri]
MDYTRKTLILVSINRNSNVNKDVKSQYGLSMLNINDSQLIFLDETGFNLHYYQKGYSPKKTKCYINVTNSKGQNISVLCAITKENVLRYQIKSGGFISLDILNFIDLKLPLLPQEIGNT